MKKTQRPETQIEFHTSNQLQLFESLWDPLKTWIEREGWKGYPYSSNDDIIPSLAKAAGAIFKSEIAEILTWLKKKGYIEVLQLGIGYVQAFPKFPDIMDFEFKRIFLQRKIADANESP